MSKKSSNFAAGFEKRNFFPMRLGEASREERRNNEAPYLRSKSVKRSLFRRGALAHLVERNVRNVKVVGSSPICSTKRHSQYVEVVFLCYA